MNHFAKAILLFASAAKAADMFEPEQDIKAPMGCAAGTFCNLFMMQKEANMMAYAMNTEEPVAQYSVTSDVTISDAQDTLSFALKNPKPSEIITSDLTVELKFYQEGIMQVNIKAEGDDDRFAISSTGIGVEWSQLNQVDNLKKLTDFSDDKKVIVSGLQSTCGRDKFSYEIQLSPFRIIQYINGETSIVINDYDTLHYANKQKTAKGKLGEDVLIEGYQVGLGFTMSSEHLYGLPQRASSFLLEETGEEPLRMFNQDKFPHEYGTKDPLYGSWPYLTGHSAGMDQSIGWMNSSETFVFLDKVTNKQTNDPSMLGSFVSLGNQLEFFVFGTAQGPKTNQHTLSELTGYAPMPPLHSLGFHYCKYEENSADLMMKRNDEFTEYGFPVDVFWSDLYYTQDFEYFVFDHETFPISKVHEMNAKIEKANRRLVMINDPHIKASEDYFVYKQGLELENADQEEDNVTNIFIRDNEAKEPWVGKCWPGESVWIDYLNENAQDFWKSLYSRKNFLGSNYLYGTWNDMNEPSVFKGSVEIEQLGMPMDNTHIMTDGTVVQHRWVHNAYGALMHRASWQGLLERDQGQLRPFVLTRSTFFGSQRYGAMWTGDSLVDYSDVPLYVEMAQSLGISGMIFTGADLPGFVGTPNDDNFIEEYQAGVFYPFFRAHADISSLSNREPWMRSQRVQDVIRNTIHQRYAQTHYLYTTFKHATETGTPIIRPTWYEFPEDSKTFDKSTQFMFGDKFLVSPKQSSPSEMHRVFHAPVDVEVYLPPSTNWYSYYSKQVIPSSHDVQTVPVQDSEQATFIREGSILPLLNFQRDRMSLLDAINDPIHVHVYPTIDEQTAAGDLYLDDGENNNYLNNERTEVQFTWDGQELNVMKTLTDENSYGKASGKYINEVTIYNIEAEPTKIVDTYASSMPNQNEVELPFVFNSEEKSLTAYGFMIPVDSSLTYSEAVTLLTFTWDAAI